MIPWLFLNIILGAIIAYVVCLTRWNNKLDLPEDFNAVQLFLLVAIAWIALSLAAYQYRPSQVIEIQVKMIPTVSIERNL